MPTGRGQGRIARIRLLRVRGLVTEILHDVRRSGPLHENNIFRVIASTMDWWRDRRSPMGASRVVTWGRCRLCLLVF